LQPLKSLSKEGRRRKPNLSSSTVPALSMLDDFAR
jgi:hypothetical protein